MSSRPVPASARPLRDLLARVLAALLAPRVEPGPRARDDERFAAGLPRYAMFDTPTYQRRGLRICGIDSDSPPARA